MQYLLLVPVLYLMICAVLALLQRRLLYSPTQDWIGTPEDIGLPYEDVWIASESEAKVHAWYLPHERPRAAVLFCHGNGGNNSHRLDSLRLMHDLGMSALIFDYPGYGQSGGSPSQKSMLQSAHLAREWLQARPELAGLPLILWGRSLGGAVGALLTKTEPPDLLILESSFPNMVAVASHLYPYLPVHLLLVDRWPAAPALAHLDCPKLIVHSEEDDLIPFALGQELYEAAAEPKAMLRIHGGHEGGWFDSGELYTRAIREFIGANLPSLQQS